MTKKHQWLLGMLVGGLLLCGLGGGVMFGEFSELTYGGRYVYRTDKPETQTIQVSLEELPEGPVSVRWDHWNTASLLRPVVVDETMEEGIVKIEMTYDPEAVYPVFYAVPAAPEENTEYAGFLELHQYAYSMDLAQFFALKDIVLRDLRNNTIRSYDMETVFGLTISAAPETAARLVL